MVNFVESDFVSFTVQTEEDSFHKKKKGNYRQQRRNLIKKKEKAQVAQKPLAFDDLKSQLPSDLQK